MDQVKVYLGVAKKHHFWILAVIIVIVAIVVWMMATKALASKFTADKQTIESAKQAVEKAANTGEDGLLPNRSFKEKVDTLHQDLKQQVYQAWEKLYARQSGLFHWPDMDVGRDQPYNIGKEVKPNGEIPASALAVFNQQYVEQEWADLFEKVRIRRPVGSDEEGDANGADDENSDGIARRGGDAGAVEYEGLVVWPKDRRDAIIERYHTEGTPSSLKVWLAQEDFWLFESLIGIINEVNGDATDSRKAPIKKIESLDVAQWAIADSLDGASPLIASGSSDAAAPTAAAPTAATPTAAAPTAAGPTAAGPTAAGPTAASPAADASASAAEAAKAEDLSLLSGRYLDDKGQPFVGAQPGDPYAGPYAEFKQVFVHMKLVMDHRKIPDLMAACGNASLPVETREVRIQMLEPQKASGAPNNAFGNFGGGMGMLGGAAQEGDVETLEYDAIVELSGVIYLYNVPDLAKLGTGTSGSPANRFFGVPSTAVSIPRGGRGPGGAAGIARQGGPMQGTMGNSMMPSGPPGMQGMNAQGMNMMGGKSGSMMPSGPPGMQGMNMMGGSGSSMRPPMGPPGMNGPTGAKP